MGWRDDRRLQVGQFLYSNRTNLVRYQQHQHWCTKQNRTAFHCVLMENEQKTSDKIACFPGAQKRPCGWCCTTVVWSILVFKPYKLSKISTTSALMYDIKQNSFSLRLEWKRTKNKWQNCLFSRRSKTALWVTLHDCCLVNSCIQTVQTC